MDYADMLRDAWTYTRQGVIESGSRWVRLIFAIILLTIPMNGYLMRIYRGTDSAPAVDGWGRLCIDGLKLIIVSLIYSIPILLVWLATYWSVLAGIISGTMDPAALAGWEPNLALLILMYVVEFVIALLLPTVMVRFARSNSFCEAFNFRAIFDHIAQIGWFAYILAIIVVTVVVAIPVVLLVFIFILLGIAIGALAGFSTTAILGSIAVALLVLLILLPIFTIFQARFWTRLYDSAATPT